jgi:hypothetical protein
LACRSRVPGWIPHYVASYDGTATPDWVDQSAYRGGVARNEQVARVPWWGLACLAFVLFALLLEIAAGSAAGVAAPAWVSRVVPLAWPPLARAGWWLGVAAAGAGYRVAERRAGAHRHPLVVAASVAPFALFALGAAMSAPWAAWH